MSLRVADELSDFAKRNISLDDDKGQPVERAVYVSGDGPAVIVLHEMPGISPHVVRFARWVREAGFTVLMPSLFGNDGAVPQAKDGGQVFQRACIAREFHVLAGQGASPVTVWLRHLASRAHAECGGPGVGAIGMCFTGNFALSMMLEPSVIAPVLCQPSLPLDDPAAIESTDEEVRAIRERLDHDDLTVRAYRFDGDQICRAVRFRTYQDKFGDRFLARTLPDRAADVDVSPFFQTHVNYPHSVVTQHLIDQDGEPTQAARDEIIAFFGHRLKT